METTGISFTQLLSFSGFSSYKGPHLKRNMSAKPRRKSKTFSSCTIILSFFFSHSHSFLQIEKNCLRWRLAYEEKKKRHKIWHLLENLLSLPHFIFCTSARLVSVLCCRNMVVSIVTEREGIFTRWEQAKNEKKKKICIKRNKVPEKKKRKVELHD